MISCAYGVDRAPVTLTASAGGNSKEIRLALNNESAETFGANQPIVGVRVAVVLFATLDGRAVIKNPIGLDAPRFKGKSGIKNPFPPEMVGRGMSVFADWIPGTYGELIDGKYVIQWRYIPKSIEFPDEKSLLQEKIDSAVYMMEYRKGSVISLKIHQK